MGEPSPGEMTQGPNQIPKAGFLGLNPKRGQFIPLWYLPPSRYKDKFEKCYEKRKKKIQYCHLFIFGPKFNCSIIPFFEGHVPNDVTAMTPTHDQETGQQKISNVNHAPSILNSGKKNNEKKVSEIQTESERD